MALNILDPTMLAQLRADMQNGIVPAWNPNDRDQAQAFVNYFNDLTGVDDAMQLVEHTTYTFKITER